MSQCRQYDHELQCLVIVLLGQVVEANWQLVGKNITNYTYFHVVT